MSLEKADQRAEKVARWLYPFLEDAGRVNPQTEAADYDRNLALGLADELLSLIGDGG